MFNRRFSRREAKLLIGRVPLDSGIISEYSATTFYTSRCKTLFYQKYVFLKSSEKYNKNLQLYKERWQAKENREICIEWL